MTNIYAEHWQRHVLLVWANFPATFKIRRELAGVQNKKPSVLYVFEHKTKKNLIHASYTRTVAFWHISNIPPMIL